MRMLLMLVVVTLAGCAEDGEPVPQEPEETAAAPKVTFQVNQRDVKVAATESGVAWRDVTVYYRPASGCSYELIIERGNTNVKANHNNVDHDIGVGDRLSYGSGCTGTRIHHDASGVDLLDTRF